MKKGYEIKKKNLNIVISKIETVLFHKNRTIEISNPVKKKDIIDVKLRKEVNINTL